MSQDDEGTPLRELNAMMKERRQFLQEMIDNAKSRARISRDLKLAIFALSTELVSEAVEHADAAMNLNEGLSQAYQTLREENSQLIIQNRVLLGAMMNRKFFQVIANLH